MSTWHEIGRSVTDACTDRASDIEALADYLWSDLDLAALPADARNVIERHVQKLRAAAKEIRGEHHLSPASDLSELVDDGYPISGPVRDLRDAIAGLADRRDIKLPKGKAKPKPKAKKGKKP